MDSTSHSGIKHFYSQNALSVFGKYKNLSCIETPVFVTFTKQLGATKYHHQLRMANKKQKNKENVF